VSLNNTTYQALFHIHFAPTLHPLISLSIATTMASKVNTLLSTLKSAYSSGDYNKAKTTLSSAKLELLKSNALVPDPTTPQAILTAAREILQLGALTAIHLQDPEGFTRYWSQLQPFYELSPPSTSDVGRSKITGLYLLLLLSQGDNAGFHTLLEALEMGEAAKGSHGNGLESDEYIQYPIKLEQWLMEGAYDKVWGATKSEQVPSEEYSLFSEVSAVVPKTWQAGV
jgi:26S proteasome regulatory subunit N12